jgi:hypothetical protein
MNGQKFDNVSCFTTSGQQAFSYYHIQLVGNIYFIFKDAGVSLVA